MQEGKGISNQRESGVRGNQEEEQRGRRSLWMLQTLLALKMEEGCPAEEDRGPWEPEKAKQWTLPCSLEKEGSLWRRIGWMSSLHTVGKYARV